MKLYILAFNHSQFKLGAIWTGSISVPRPGMHHAFLSYFSSYSRKVLGMALDSMAVGSKALDSMVLGMAVGMVRSSCRDHSSS